MSVEWWKVSAAENEIYIVIDIKIFVENADQRCFKHRCADSSSLLMTTYKNTEIFCMHFKRNQQTDLPEVLFLKLSASLLNPTSKMSSAINEWVAKQQSYSVEIILRKYF